MPCIFSNAFYLPPSELQYGVELQIYHWKHPNISV